MTSLAVWVQQLAVPLSLRCEWCEGQLRCARGKVTYIERLPCGGVLRWLCWKHGEALRGELDA